MLIQQIRNATLKIEYAGLVFLIDPWLQDRGTGFSARAVREEMQGIKCPMDELPDTPHSIVKGIDCCLVTHLHFDHFSADYLPKDIDLVVQNEENAAEVRKMGFKKVSVFPPDALVLGGVTVHRTKAVHGENEAVVEKMGEVCGYVFEAPGEKTLYLAADTVYCPDVELTIEKYQPQVIILNCCDATAVLGRLIMNLNDVEKVCRKSPDAYVIASHLDSVNHAMITSDDVRRFAEEKGLRRVIVPGSGERIAL